MSKILLFAVILLGGVLYHGIPKNTTCSLKTNALTDIQIVVYTDSSYAQKPGSLIAGLLLYYSRSLKTRVKTISLIPKSFSLFSNSLMLSGP